MNTDDVAEEAERKRVEGLRPAREKILMFSEKVETLDLSDLPDDPLWVRQKVEGILELAAMEINRVAMEL